MRRLILATLMLSLFAPAAGRSEPPEQCPGRASCSGCRACVPACKATWEEKKSSQPNYSMKCEYACVRGRDPWHAPPPECRCRPPCGHVIVKKRLYKSDGPAKLERVPKYEVQMVPAEPCGCPDCRGLHAIDWLHPLRLLAACLPW